MGSRRALLVGAACLALLAAGCIGSDESQPAAPQSAEANATVVPNGTTTLTPSEALNFSESVVDPAVGVAHGLYEPTVDVSDSGAIYVAGHVNGVLTTGTPAYVSNDGGSSWQQLPVAGSARAPAPVQSGGPPNGDEGYIVTGDDGRAWMVDIALYRYPVTGYCDDGAEQCYYHPDAFDRAAATTSPATGDCDASTALNDRPWAAYANGTLLMVNSPVNAATPGNRIHVGAMDVPRGTPAEAASPEWNLCAAPGGADRAGDPALRDDGRFVVPQRADGSMRVVTGNVDDIRDVQVREVVAEAGYTDGADYGDPQNWGRSAFDARGTLFVAALSGSDASEQITVATSTDGGRNFTAATYDVGSPLGFLYVDGNPSGPGALVTWTQDGNGSGTADFYAAHLQAGPDGTPILSDASLVADDVENPRGDVYGSAVGPEGRAHVAVYEYPGPFPEGVPDYAGTNPLSVYVQEDGPRLPTPDG